MWLHVDAAYAGSALVCPEFQYSLYTLSRRSKCGYMWMLLMLDPPQYVQSSSIHCKLYLGGANVAVCGCCLCWICLCVPRVLVFTVHSIQEEQMWLHVDAAYAGSAFVCPEFQYSLYTLSRRSKCGCMWMLLMLDPPQYVQSSSIHCTLYLGGANVAACGCCLCWICLCVP